MSISLTTLPPELFSCIVASIESQSTLYNLAQCSRQVYHWTIPHLYHHVTIQEKIIRADWQQAVRLRKLATLLIQRPDLAELVRSLTLHIVTLSESEDSEDYEDSDDSEDSEESGDHEDSEESEEHESRKLAKVDQAFKTAIKAAGLSKVEENSWLSHLCRTGKCEPDLILALLLPILHKVEKLVLNLSDGSNNTYHLDRMIRVAARRETPFDIQPLFEALTVFIAPYERDNLHSKGLIASLLRFPAIQVISTGLGTRSWGMDPEDKDLVELESSSSPLTSLNLAAWRGLSIIDLGHILRAPKALKVFTYRVCREDPIFSTIRHILEPQKNCLESLGFDYDEGIELVSGMGINTDYLQPMTSFISFNNLKVFKTAAVFLEKTDNGTGRYSLVNIFPPSLETLHLTGFEAHFESILEAVEHLLAQKSPHQIPSLKNLILEEITLTRPRIPNKLMDVLWRGTQETAIGRLTRVAAAQGVSLDVIHRSEDHFPYGSEPTNT